MATGDKTIIAKKSQVDALDLRVGANENSISTLDSKRLSAVASYVMVGGSAEISNTEITKNFATVLYTGNGGTQDIDTGISSIDFTVSNNGTGYWLDRSTFEVKLDDGTVVDSGEIEANISKVHIKNRDTANYHNIVLDGLRGSDRRIKTNTDDAEEGNENSVSFSNAGIALNSDYIYVNEDTKTYVLYQTLYTHVKWGLTSQNKKYIEAFNPITRETMIMYEGSGSSGQEIPHSLGVNINFAQGKNLTTSGNWSANRGLDDNYLSINQDIAESVNTAIITKLRDTYIEVGTGGQINTSGDQYILYGKAKSENWTIVEYVGTGASGNFIETKDVYGVPRKPARVIIKRIDSNSNWIVYDSKRVGKQLFLNLYDEEHGVSSLSQILQTGFMAWVYTASDVNQRDNELNARYIALVEFDTNSDGGDGYFKKPTADTKLSFMNPSFSYTDGRGANGYNVLIDNTPSFTATESPADGLWYCSKQKDKTTISFYKNIMNSLYNKEFADDNRLVFNTSDGKLWTTKGGELITNGTFDANTDGWSGYNGVTLSVDSGRLKATGDATDYGYFNQVISGLEEGTTYKVVFTHTSTDTSSRVYVLMQDSVIDTGYTTNLTKTYEYEVVMDSGGHIEIRGSFSSTDNSIAYLDNVSVYKLEATLDTPLEIPVSFLPNPVFYSNGVPQYIAKSKSLASVVVDTLEVEKKLLVKDIAISGEVLGKNQCTGWVAFDGTNGIIIDSYNVASVVRKDTGLYRLILENELDNTNYIILGSTENGNSNYQNQDHVSYDSTDGTRTTSEVAVFVQYVSADSSGLINRNTVWVFIIGGRD